MAHRFAARSSVNLEFVPLKRLERGPELLNSGYCDALFNSLALDLNRTGAAAQ